MTRLCNLYRVKKTKYLVSDADNLFVLIYPSGKKSFVFDYKDPNTRKLKRLTLGKYGEMSLKEAREKKNELKYLLSKYGKITHNSNSAESFQNIA